MDPAEIDALVRRLVADPHDEDALAYAHQQGEHDPKAYAFLLEKVGNETPDPSYASHWLAEAANVWSTTLGDAHRAARVLMMAIDKDPTQATAADRLATLYRDKGDYRGLVALLERRTKALGPMTHHDPRLRSDVAAMHEELGRLWAEPPLSQPRKAIESYRRAFELDPNSAYAIFQARELLKQAGQMEEALALYAPEFDLERDPQRRAMLLRDEATARRAVGDLAGASRALYDARAYDDSDPALAQEYAQTVLDRLMGGDAVEDQERATAAQVLVGLAEQFDGEHGVAYASGALDLQPGHDRALELFAYYAHQLGRGDEATPRYAAYLQANPTGALAAEARRVAGSAAPYSAPPPPPPAPDSLTAAPVARPGLPPRDEASSSYSAVESSSRRVAPNQGPLTPDKLQGILDAAQMLAGKGRKPEAFVKYKEVLEADPAHPEALSWVEEYLRAKRDYAMLRDILLASVRFQASQSETMETRKERLREVAGICEGNLRDIDGAIGAWKQLFALDRSDESARTALTRLLEKQQRWDDLANLLEQEATSEAEIASKVALEKKLALLHEQKRRDPGAAGEAWARIARLTPDDDRPTVTASKLFEKAGQIDMAASVIAENAPHVDDAAARGNLFERLGELKEQLGDARGAGDAYAEGAELLKVARLWEAAERCFVTADAFERAAHAAGQRALLAGDPKLQAAHFARAAELLAKTDDETGAIRGWEQAADLDPLADEYAAALQERYTARGEFQKLAEFLAKRGDRVTDRGKRVAIRRQTATLYAAQLQDKELARELWLKVLEDGDDREALEKLVDFAVEREDHTEAITLLRRLQANTVDTAEKTRVALREAELLADGLGDVETAIARYEQIIKELDPTCRPALQAIADLQEARDQIGAAADALERELKLIADPHERGTVAARLSRLYDTMGDAPNSIRALDLVRKGDPEDFEALARLCDLCERTEQWSRVASLLAERIEVEGDEDEAAEMTRKLAGILAEKLDRGDEALAVLTDFADQGNASCRSDYIELGDRLGWKGIVAQKLVEWWFEAKHGPERITALRGAFERFEAVGREQDAARVAMEIVRCKGADRELAERLERLSTKTNDHDALCLAHDLLSRDLSGAERAAELVRQAEVRVKAGMPRGEALQHGEAGLTSVPLGEADPLLERLSQLAAKPNDVIDLYERHVGRAKAPLDRVRALGKAAQVASTRGQLDRARSFFELAISATPNEDTLSTLEAAAREGDGAAGGEKLRRTLGQAMAAGGTGARDGGKTRSSLLRRAAMLAHRDLGDVDQAFAWLGDALVAHVDAPTLDALEALGAEVGDPRRAEEAISHALSDVFDGPLVRQLLARRAKIRREQLIDKQGAAADLKKLHDLSPNDQAVMESLSGLLTELGDYRGMVQLFEDQILRGKDMGARAELARKVARMWEEQLADPREAADAWRRVLRMKPGDAEATEGLDRAKGLMLKRPKPADSGPEVESEGPTTEIGAGPASTTSPTSSRSFVPPSSRSIGAPLSARPTEGETAEAPTIDPRTMAFTASDEEIDDATEALSSRTATVELASLRKLAPAPLSQRSMATQPELEDELVATTGEAPSHDEDLEVEDDRAADTQLATEEVDAPESGPAPTMTGPVSVTFSEARDSALGVRPREATLQEEDDLRTTGDLTSHHTHDEEPAAASLTRPKLHDSTNTPATTRAVSTDDGEMTDIGSSPAMMVDDEEILIADDDDLVIVDGEEEDESAVTDERPRPRSS